MSLHVFAHIERQKFFVLQKWHTISISFWSASPPDESAALPPAERSWKPWKAGRPPAAAWSPDPRQWRARTSPRAGCWSGSPAPPPRSWPPPARIPPRRWCCWRPGGTRRRGRPARCQGCAPPWQGWKKPGFKKKLAQWFFVVIFGFLVFVVGFFGFKKIYLPRRESF